LVRPGASLPVSLTGRPVLQRRYDRARSLALLQAPVEKKI